MATYAALLSLNHIIEQLQHHPRPPISMDQNHVQSLIQNITFLLDFLEVYSYVRNEDLDRLQSCIAEAAYAAEDVIESHIVDQILAESTTHGEQICSVDFYQGLQKVIQDMDFIKKEVMEIKEKIGSVQYNQQHRRRSIPAAASLRSSSTEKNTMVDFGDVSEEIMDKLTRRQPNRQIIPIVGMGGIGKTTLAKTVYEDQLIVQHFDIRGWATISQEYSVKEILLELLHDQGSQESLRKLSQQELGEMLYKRLYGKRYLIIMDDLWSIEAWDRLKRYFPQNDRGSGIMITSRLSNLAADIPGANIIKMSFLNDDKSWNLLRKTVFGEDDCPVELEKTGKKIAKKCEGLPLSLVVIGGLLRKSQQTREYWEYIAENLNSVVNLEDNECCLNLLYMSYNYLPVHLKPCFLYMGITSEDEKIWASKLIKLWVAEGFLKPISGKSLEEVAKEYLKALVDRNLILVDEWKRNGKIKLCKMHDLLRDLCIKEAKKDKFLCVARLQSPNKFPQDTSTQRRIVIHRSRYEEEYCLPQIRNASQFSPLARSLICNNLKIWPSLKLRIWKVFDFPHGKSDNSLLEFPFQSVNLRLIDFDVHSSVPYQISLYSIWNLQTLIVSNSELFDSKLPLEIWKMPHLRHVRCFSIHLTYPERGDFILKNLNTLSRIKNFKCGEEVVKRIPNVKKLRLYYSDKFAGSHYHLNNLRCLDKLQSLCCDFYQDEKLSRSDFLQNLTFPPSLKKLTLAGNGGLHWEDISTKIGSLPLLEAFTLEGDLFIGTEWETVENQFPSLKFLMIDGSNDLECWTTDSTHFPRLEHLELHFLCKLKEIPQCIGDIQTLQRIELIVCTNSAVFSAKKIAEEQDELENKDLQVRVASLHKNEELESLASHNFKVEALFKNV